MTEQVESFIVDVKGSTCLVCGTSVGTEKENMGSSTVDIKITEMEVSCRSKTNEVWGR